MKVIKKYQNPSGKLMRVAIDGDYLDALPTFYWDLPQEDQLNIFMNNLNIPLDGGQLPEVQVYQTDKDKQTLRNFKKTFIKPLRQDIRKLYNINYDGGWNSISANDFLDNIIDMHNLGNNPGINAPKFYSKWFVHDDGRPRAFYNMLTNSMYNIGNSEEYLSELAHAIQYQNSKYSRKYAPQSFEIPGDFSPFGERSGYERPGHSEYNAHEIIEPAIYDYIFQHSNNVPGHDYNFEDLLKERTRIASDESNYRDEEYKDSVNYKGLGIIKRALMNLDSRGFNLDDEGYPIWKHTLKKGGKL